MKRGRKEKERRRKRRREVSFGIFIYLLLLLLLFLLKRIKGEQEKEENFVCRHFIEHLKFPTGPDHQSGKLRTKVLFSKEGRKRKIPQRIDLVTLSFHQRELRYIPTSPFYLMLISLMWYSLWFTHRNKIDAIIIWLKILFDFFYLKISCNMAFFIKILFRRRLISYFRS